MFSNKSNANNEYFLLDVSRAKIAGVPGATLIFRIQVRNVSPNPLTLTTSSNLSGTREPLSYELMSEGKILSSEIKLMKEEKKDLELILKTTEKTPIKTQGIIKLIFSYQQKTEIKKELRLYFYVLEEISMLLKINSKIVHIKDQDPFMLDFPPYIKNNRTFVPLRFIGESFGATIQWFDKEKKVTYDLRGKNLTLWINQSRYLINGIPKTMDATPEIQPPGRTFVPIRVISEELGAQVDWSAPLQEVKITYRISN